MDGTGVSVMVGGMAVIVGGRAVTLAAGETAELQETSKHKQMLDAIEQI